MSDVNWWMDANCRWHKGLPPPGWWQARNGRWHPPVSEDTTTEMTISPSTGAAHLAGGGRRANLVAIYRGWPRWARLAAPIAAFVLTIGVLAAAATGGLLDDDPETATDETAPSTEPSTTVAPPTTAGPPTHATTTTVLLPNAPTPAQHDPLPITSATTPSPEPPTTTAPTSNDIHPGAPCSPEGATAISSDGIPMTCTRQKCHGAPFSEPRWRRTTC